MNGIKQYFSSLPKTGENSSAEDKEASQARPDGKVIVSNMESVMKSVRKKRSKKKRLSPDGDITDISNILSCSLNLISPKKASKKDACNGKFQEVSVPAESEDQENLIDVCNGDQKKNVFEVMMQARERNSIGLTPNSTPQERKRRLPEEFTQEDTGKKSKKAKKTPDTTEDNPKQEESRKKLAKPSRKKKLFELEVEAVDFPRKDPESQDNASLLTKPDEAKRTPRRRGRPLKAEKIVLEETVVVIPEETKAKEASEQGENRPLRSKKLPKKVEIDEIVISDTDSPQRRPQRSCRQKVLTYSIDLILEEELNSSRSPEKPKSVRKSAKEKNSEVIIIDCDYSPKKSVKLAPIFVKPQKIEIDPKVLKAKQEFLMSGIPEVMKLSIEKQKALEEEFELRQFPEVSHVTQIEGDALMEKISWREDEIRVRISDYSEEDDIMPIIWTDKRKIDLIDKPSNMERPRNGLPGTGLLTNAQKSSIFKQLLKNFDKFPTKKAFSFFKKRSEVGCDDDFSENVLFTERYRPERSEEFLISNSAVEELKSFLVSFQSDTSRFNSTFESDLEDSCSNYGNSCCIVLSGPCGSGKSASVAAVAAQLNFNVLEINAGMRRTGKRLLQDLQEATQSHKVARSSEDETSQKFSLILVEDAEITFEQDDGFVSAIHQIVADSKRPVILTTSEPNCSHLARFMAMNTINFAPPEPELISKWFTLMALAEGVHLQEDDVNTLYKYNGQDVRKTSNDLEFLVRSGGGDFLNEGISSAALTMASFDTLWSNADQWLKTGAAQGEKIEDFSEFYDFICSSEVLNDRLENEELSQCLLAKTLRMREISDKHYDHFRKPREITRTCLSSTICEKTAQFLDYEPILRTICRNERDKASKERRSSRFSHYLRQVVNNPSNELFIEHCKIFS
ncbi:enhanced level of genomic instability 1 [Phlebotomus argentipes]|uniref:enhanced level of genomic instability 1 n=1 Tax=Phlebotomus argentipes TaxID=94469 RepID=UPI002892E914|nr:enhanced level of genomic instability 1 [Phlebotomus argentipes]XP_059620509.1 enhanced level of genomic instability 1 [Phlebotomus argentipes]